MLLTERKVTVLLVEAEAELREATTLVFEDAGFTIVGAGTGEEAIELIRDHAGKVDWLFTDIRLPGVIDGWRVADEFRFSYPLRPVVFATGALAEKPRGIWDSLFVRKPYRVSEVVRAFELLSKGWASCDSEAEALGRVKRLNLGAHFSWAPPREGQLAAAE